MPQVLAAALLLTIIAGSIPAPSPSISALAPVEVVADGFGSLRGLAIDTDDRVYVADRDAGTVSRLDPGAPRIIARRLERPIGIAIDALGHVLVAEERGGRVVRLDAGGPTPIVQGIKQPRWLASDGRTLYISARRLTRGVDPEPDDESIEPEAILALGADGTLTVFADGFDHLQGLAVRDGILYAATTGIRGANREDGVVYRIPVRADGRAGPMVPLTPRAGFERPIGIAIDRLGALFVSTPAARVDGQRSRQAVVKLPAGGDGSLFAAWLDGPRGLAFDSHGNLYVADGAAGRVVRFLAPAAPTLAGVPRFTNRTPLPISGTTVPNARLDVFVDALSVSIASLAGPSGAFTSSIPLSVNGETDLDVFATAARGDGLTTSAAEASVIHDSTGPSLVFQSPPATSFVRGTVRVRAQASDGESQIGSLALSAAGQTLGTSVVPSLPSLTATATASWSTTAFADGTQTLSVMAVDRAGNTATSNQAVIVDNTPPATEIISGPSATTSQPIAVFAFTGTDNLTPSSSLQFAWSLDGGPPSEFSAAATATLGPLPSGPHIFEVRARDLAGNEDATPARREFVVTAAGIAISEPAPGEAVAVGTLLVRGSVNAGTADVGVSVNGFGALVSGSQWAVEVPTQLGPNAITAIAVLGDGTEATTSISVTASEAEPTLTLRAEPASGLAPLAVTWRVASRTPRPLVSFQLDPTGGGAYGGPVASLEGTESIYSTTGLLFPTLRATDDQGQVYIARTIVQVDDPLTVSARFKSLWSSFTARLQAGDHAGALAHLTPGLRPQFTALFQLLAPDLPGIAAGFPSVELIDQVGDLAEAALVQLEQGTPILYFIYFRRDNRGRWLIQEM
jgi:sugar lactone lactonase YvrE